VLDDAVIHVALLSALSALAALVPVLVLGFSLKLSSTPAAPVASSIASQSHFDVFCFFCFFCFFGLLGVALAPLVLLLLLLVVLQGLLLVVEVPQLLRPQNERSGNGCTTQPCCIAASKTRQAEKGCSLSPSLPPSLLLPVPVPVLSSSAVVSELVPLTTYLGGG
jgi:hypothetical protein